MFSPLLNLLRESRWPVWLLSFYVFIWFLQIGDRIEPLGAIRIEFLVGVTLILISAKELLNASKSPQQFHAGFIKSIYCLYAVFAIYTIFSMDSKTSWFIFNDRIIKFSMFTLFVGALVKSKAEIVLFLVGFILAMTKIIQEGIFGILTGGMIWENQGVPRLHGVTLLYRHPNSLSGLAVGALPFFLFLYRFQSKLMKLFFIGAIVGLLMIILYTGSRTGYVATLIMFFAILLRLGLFKFKTIITMTMVVIIGFIAIPQDYKDRFATMFQSEEERGSSANKRIEILEDAWAIAKKYPLGIGVAAFPYVRDIEFNRQQDTHNLYLEILTNIGPFGLLVFFIFISMLFKTNIRSRERLLLKKDYFLAELCYIVNLYVLCRLALGLFGMDLYEVYWWFAAGLTVALAKLSVKEIDVKSVPDQHLAKN